MNREIEDLFEGLEDIGRLAAVLTGAKNHFTSLGWSSENAEEMVLLIAWRTVEAVETPDEADAPPEDAGEAS